MELRKYQRAAIDATYDFWIKGGGNPLIVAPCGAGKSVIIAALCHEALSSWPSTRILILTHRKELLRQNGAELQGLWPEAPIGYYSAGLRRKDTTPPILFAGVQSIHRRITELEPFDLVIVDEAHLVPRNLGTQYGSTLANLRLMDPLVKVIGLTATPYRLDSGRLDEGEDALFDAVVYDIPVQQLVDAGHLVEVVARGGRAKADLAGVHRRMGDFVASEVSAAFTADGLVDAACGEIVAAGAERKAWMVFCAGVEHARQVRDALRARGVDAETVTGETPEGERDAICARFKAGKLRCLVNVDVLTTGANFPICDLLVLLRATESTALYVQIVGRGMRVYPGKSDCLLLDFGGNVVRHGPIDAVDPRRPGKGGEPPAKECPKCQTIVPVGVRLCPACGFEWPQPKPREIKHDVKPYEGAVLARQQKPQWVEVTGMRYARHQKAGSPDSVRVVYEHGLLQETCEWWCVEHAGYAAEKAAAKMRAAGMKRPLPRTVSEFLARVEELRRPAAIEVKPDGRYTRIVGCRYELERGAGGGAGA